MMTDTDKKSMRILLVMDPDIPIPPKLYGGIERIVYMLVCEYMNLGHHVTLLAGPGADVPCQSVTFGTTGSRGKSTYVRMGEVFEVWNYFSKHHREFDVIHSFGRLLYFLPILNQKVKKVMSYQRYIAPRSIHIVTRLPQQNLFFTALSHSCSSKGNFRGHWDVVYNGVPIEHYSFSPEVDVDAPLIFLGRLDRIKGAHTAVRVALDTHHKLIIAGNEPDLPHEIAYYEKEVRPFIDGKQIVYVGPVNDEQKNFYLGRSKALLFPIEWEEPFGIVMAESLACGTPVIGFNRGAVPEVITDQITGFVCNGFDEMKRAVQNISLLNRQACRRACEERFSSRKVALDYILQVYQK